MRAEYLAKYSDGCGRPLSEVIVISPRRSKSKTYLGNPSLHRNKSVMIEAGNIPRAKVMDGHIIDRYLMLGVLNLSEHQAGEYLLHKAAQGGLWATGANWKSAGGSRYEHSPTVGFAFGNAIAGVRDKFGWFHAYLMGEVVLRDWDVAGDDFRLGVLREGLNWVSLRRCGAGEPWKRLRRIKKSPVSAGV